MALTTSDIGGISSYVTTAAVAAGYQPLSGNLTAFAQVMPTTYGLNLTTRTDAGAARTLLGLGTLATQSGSFSGTHSGTSSGTNSGDQDLSGLVPKTTTVNGQALSTNVTVTSVSGNAGTATALATARAINGVNFDGTAAITVPVALSRTAVKTSAYTAAAGDLVPCDTTAGPLTVTLPAAPADKFLVCVKLVTQGGTNAVTVQCGGSDVFNKTGGPVSGTLSLLNQAMLVQYSAGAGVWTVVADDLPLSVLDARFAPLAGSTALVTTGTLTGGSTGAGFTVALSVATVTGTLAVARLPVQAPQALASAILAFTATDGPLGPWYTHALTGDVTYTTTGEAAGRRMAVSVSAGASARVVTLPAWTRFDALGSPLTLPAGKKLLIALRCTDGTVAGTEAGLVVQP